MMTKTKEEVLAEVDEAAKPEARHDSPHEECDECEGCDPSTGIRSDADPEAETDTPVASSNPLRLRSVYVSGTSLEFTIGQNNVAQLDIGDPGDGRGLVVLRVSYKGTRKPRLFFVPPQFLISELEQTDIIIAKPELVVAR